MIRMTWFVKSLIADIGLYVQIWWRSLLKLMLNKCVMKLGLNNGHVYSYVLTRTETIHLWCPHGRELMRVWMWRLSKSSSCCLWRWSFASSTAFMGASTPLMSNSKLMLWSYPWKWCSSYSDGQIGVENLLGIKDALRLQKLHLEDHGISAKNSIHPCCLPWTVKYWRLSHCPCGGDESEIQIYLENNSALFDSYPPKKYMAKSLDKTAPMSTIAMLIFPTPFFCFPAGEVMAHVLKNCPKVASFSWDFLFGGENRNWVAIAQIFVGFSPGPLGKWSNFTSMFFKWVAQLPTRISGLSVLDHENKKQKAGTQWLNLILLMEEILHHLGCIKPCK